MAAYATFLYGGGTLYGGTQELPIAELLLSVTTPSFDTVSIEFGVEFVVNPAYLSTSNYSIVDGNTVLGVRKVLEPTNGSTSSKIILVVDRHTPGTEYTFTVSGILRRDGYTLSSSETSFVSKQGKADNMLASIPRHFNTDATASTIRQVLQAVAASDTLIGGV